MDRPLTLAELQRIRRWHVAHKDEHPLEYQLWDAVLTVWLMGWVGWLPALILDAVWALPLCVLAVCAPRIYVTWRRRAHAAHRLRCDWLSAAASGI